MNVYMYACIYVRITVSLTELGDFNKIFKQIKRKAVQQLSKNRHLVQKLVGNITP